MAPLFRLASVAQLGVSSITLTLIFVFYCLCLSLPRGTNADCYNNGNFTANSTYAENRRRLLSSLPSNVSANGGFFSGSLGTGPDTVYALSYCSGDLPAQNWPSAVNSTVVQLMQSCPYQKQAAAFRFDTPCSVRYSDRPIYGILDTSSSLALYNTGDIGLSQDTFYPIWKNHLDSLAAKASKGSSSSKLKFATGEASLPDFRTIYALLQCSPDLSASDCNECLVGSREKYWNCCRGKAGGVIAQTSCFLRWDLYYFYQYSPIPPPPSPVQPPPPSPPDSPPPVSTNNPTTVHKDGLHKAFRAVVIVVPAISFLVIAVILFLSCSRRWKLSRKPEAVPTSTEEWSGDDSRMLFKLSEIRAATNDFSDTNKLGQGGFGKVYKGKLATGQQIAVKRLERCSHEGQHQFKNEMMLLARLQHKNLVKLVGFSFEEGERIIIYEFVPNASLDKFISDPNKRVLLDWGTRYRIIKGIARGLLYLHVDSQLTIIHRDLKPGNVLLDKELNPKIADFGTARLFVSDQSKETTTRIAGTFGYMPPEYVQHGKISLKTDVYSFGIVILEIISGRKNGYLDDCKSSPSLGSYVWENWKRGTPMNSVDRFLMGSPRSEILKCIHIALLCIQEKVARRPIMASVMMMLNVESDSLPLPSQPAFLADISNTEGQLKVQEDHPSVQPAVSINEVTISEQDPR